MMKLFAFILFAISLRAAAFSDEPLVSVTLSDGDAFSVISGAHFDVYGLSERMKPMVQSSRNRKIAAASYSTGTIVRTSDPKMAIQEILRQISEQSGLILGSFRDSRISSISPTVLLLAAGEKSVWNLLLTPKDDYTYVFSLTCLIDE